MSERPRKPLAADTSLEAERILLERLAALGPMGRLRRVADLWEATVMTATLRLRREHPEWTEHQIRVELSKSWLGAELHRRVYGSPIP